MQYTGKTIEEAINLGLEDLKITKEQAEIIVISEPVKGLFGKIKAMAIVDVVKKDEEIDQLLEEKVFSENKENIKNSVNEYDMLVKLLELLNVKATVEKSVVDEKEVLTIVSEDSSSVIGYRGEVLDALQTVIGAFANIGNEKYRKVVVDCENYRSKREETLNKLAHRLEEKATEIKREVILEPMCAFERRIIHTALADSTTVTTRSDGKEPERHVVIVPNDKDEFSKPYNAGRNEKKDFKKNNRRGGGKGFGERKTGFKKNGFTENKRVTPSGFGTYLGNSLKDKI